MMSARIVPGVDEPGNVQTGGDRPVMPAAGLPPQGIGASGDAHTNAQRLQAETEAFNRLARGDEHVTVWQPHSALAVTAREAALPRFQEAAAASAQRGFPVHIRGSGGGCMCLGPGTLVVSHQYCAADQSIERAYRDFAAKLLAAAARLGVPMRLGEAGAVGGHRLDLHCAGMRLGAIAQRRGVSAGLARVWVHAVLAIEECAAAYPQQVQTFYRDLGMLRATRPDLTTVLARCVAPQRAANLGSRFSEDLLRLFSLPVSHGRAALVRSSKDFQ